MSRGEDFSKKGKCEKIHSQSLSNSAWCDLNSYGDILKLHDICHNPRCKCEKENFSQGNFYSKKQDLEKP